MEDNEEKSIEMPSASPMATLTYITDNHDTGQEGQCGDSISTEITHSLIDESNTATNPTKVTNSDKTEIAGQSSVEDSGRTDARIRMLARIAVSDAHFKHQQRGDPDLTLQDKIEIAQRVLDSNKVSFLSRFSSYLELEDLDYFSDSRNVYEIDFYCKQVEKLKSKNFSKNRVKNRRYQAMKELVSQSEYFSEEEMKYRDPFLYHQMVGQYLTDEEIQAGIDKADLRFSSILVKHIDQLNENERFNRDKEKEECQEEEEEESESEAEVEMEEDQKGEDKESDETKPKISEHKRKELRAEFLTIMQERFMRGEDKNFNYSQVDNNEDYDDLGVLGNDAEEKYFDDQEFNTFPHNDAF